MGALCVLPVSPVSGCEMSRQSEVDCHQEENSCKSHLNCVTQEEKSVPTISLTLLIWKSPIRSPLTLSSYVTAFTYVVKENGKCSPTTEQATPSPQSLLALHLLPDTLSSHKEQPRNVSAYKTE